MSDPGPALELPLARELEGDELKTCCASVYAHPAVRWLLGEELHPGGAATTRRALELVAVGPEDRLLDVASGQGASAMFAARELGCEVVGIEYSDSAVAAATAIADAGEPALSVGFVRGDAESLPLPDAAFDVVLCECSLCTFPDKPRALAEMRRVLRSGGRLALADVVAEPGRLPEPLQGSLATLACVGSALPRSGYEALLAEAGFEVHAAESRDEDAAALAERVEERLRGARLFGFGELDGMPFGVERATELARLARRAIADGALGYVVLGARAA